MYFLIWSVHSFYFLHHLLLSIGCRFSVGCFSDGWLFIAPWVRFLVCQTISVDPFCDHVESSETFCPHTASAEHKPILCFYVNLLSTCSLSLLLDSGYSTITEVNTVCQYTNMWANKNYLVESLGERSLGRLL